MLLALDLVVTIAGFLPLPASLAATCSTLRRALLPLVVDSVLRWRGGQSAQYCALCHLYLRHRHLPLRWPVYYMPAPFPVSRALLRADGCGCYHYSIMRAHHYGQSLDDAFEALRATHHNAGPAELPRAAGQPLPGAP